MLNQDEIYKNIDKYMSIQAGANSNVYKYRRFYKNEVGKYYKSRIIKALRLTDEVSNWLSEDGTINCPCGNGEYRPTDLTIDDILVESTLPRTAVDVLKTYSVGVQPTADVTEEEETKWCREFEQREKIHSKIKRLVREMLVTGNAFFKVERGQNGLSDIVIIPTEMVTIIPDEYNPTEPAGYIYHVVRELDTTGEKYDYYEIYTLDGEVRRYTNINGVYDTVGPQLGECNLHHITGLEQNSHYPLYGASIFEGLESSFIEEIERLTSNSYLFNKVNNPSLVSSSDFSSIDPVTGEKVVSTGNFMMAGTPEDAGSTRYIEPPTSHVAAIYQHMEINRKNLYAQLGVNEVSLGLATVGGLASGEAFRKAITPTLNKCRDITNSVYIGIIEMYKQAYKIDTGKDLSIDVKFDDGVSLSDAEKISNQLNLVNGKLLSRRTILINEYGYTEQEATDELKKIAEDTESIEPAIQKVDSPEDNNFYGNNETDEDEEDDNKDKENRKNKEDDKNKESSEEEDTEESDK